MTLGGSMVASAVPTAATSLSGSSSNDGDDDAGEPAHSSSSSACWSTAAMTIAGAVEPITTNSLYYNSNGATVEDATLLQDLLLLDLPVSSQSSVHENSYPESSDHQLRAVVKTEPFPVRDTAPLDVQDVIEPAASMKEKKLKKTAKNKAKAVEPAPATEERSRGNEPATPTSQWLKWEDPNDVLDCAELPNASALEARRIKNRDSMRRSRQRQRDELDTMRDTVARLEGQYEELCLRTATTTLPLLDTQIHSNSSQAREYSYMEAIEVAKRLGAENLFLKASIQDQASWKLQLYRVLESLSFVGQLDGNDTPMDTGSGMPKTTLECEEMRAIYGFSPLTEEAMKDVILDSTRQVQDVQNELLHNQFVKSPRDRLTVFGWDIRRRMEGNEMAFAFVKRFPNASAYHIMKKTWDADLKLDHFRKIKSETRRLDILQQANANMYVMGRDVRFPDDQVVFRTVYLRFRMETSSDLPSSPSGGVSHPLCKNGYVIGTQSINPAMTVGELPMLPTIEDHERLVWADMTLWMEFFNVTDAVSGQDFCEVRWTGRTDYKSETQAFRSAADTLLGLLRWEALAIAPVLTIC